MREPLADPFIPEVVVVQSRGVARWLALQLAAESGVCANVRFPFPTDFAWELYRTLRPEVPERTPFAPEIMTWRLFDMLKALERDRLFSPVARYVGEDPLRRYELAEKLAQHYDEYLTYRPDWIQRWERLPSEHWQAALWRSIAREIDTPHRATLQGELIAALGGANAGALKLPQRVCVFGAPALPPSHLELLAALARHCAVHLFVSNPCREYWGDIEDERVIARRRAARPSEAAYLESGNRLLAAFGKQGREFFDHLVEWDRALQEEHFVEPPRDALLGAIQSDILALREPSHDGEASVIDGRDRSLQIHSCHSPAREVEVLHDQLLALFDARGIDPSEVVVMTPDIATYAPYIEAVFGTARPEIPFNISDRSAEQSSSLAETFMSLLDLASSRYEAHRVMKLLEESAIRRRFGLTESDLDTARRWLRESGIRWGIDAAHRASFGVPPVHEHTWRFGLDRLMLGYALPGAGEHLFAGVLPYDEVEGSLGPLLGRFQTFVEAAIRLRSRFDAARAVGAWCAMLQDLLQTFFDPVAEQAEELEDVRSCIEALGRDAALGGSVQPVPAEVLVAALQRRLEAPGRAFLSGGVTFCAAIPMRTLPFQVVCMLGLNDGAFPRVRRREGFDLMAEDFRKGDRSRRDDDRYLFLDSLVSAGHCLYLSYVGRHVRDDTVLPPSVLVSELLDYVERNYQLAGGAPLRGHLLTEHPLQAFSRRYFAGDERLFTYSALHASAAAVAGRGNRTSHPLVTRDLPQLEPAARTVELDALVHFFRNPARFFLQQRLGIRLNTPDEELEGIEPLVLDGLAAFDLRQRLLAHALAGEFFDGRAVARAGGVLPHGQWGDVHYDNEQSAAETMAKALLPQLPPRVLEPLAFELTLGSMTLVGTLAPLGAAGLLDYRAAKDGAHVQIRTWIRHLVLNVLAPPGVEPVTRCVTQDCTLVFAPVPDARAHLTALLALYWSGLHRPLHFFPRTACAFAEKGPLHYSVTTTWRGGGYDSSRAECDDPYYRLAFRGSDPLDAEFQAAASAVFGPLLVARTREEHR